MTVRPALPLTGGRFALFADCLLVGVLTAFAALGVVTAFPALAAACAALRARVVEDRSVGPLAYGRLLLAALRAGWAGPVVPVLAVAVLGLDAVAVAAGVPGAGALAVLLVAAASAAVVLGLRTAAAWRPGQRWPAAFARAWAASVRDAGGSALLWLAGLAAVAVALVVPLTVVLVAGPLALAAVAVDLRARPPAS